MMTVFFMLRWRPLNEANSLKLASKGFAIASMSQATLAVSSANALVKSVGNFRSSWRNKMSVASAKRSGDNGHPCEIPEY